MCPCAIEGVAEEDRRETAAPGRVLKLKEVADILRVTRVTLHKMIAKGEIRGFRIGRAWRFMPEEVDRLIEG